MHGKANGEPANDETERPSLEAVARGVGNEPVAKLIVV
jgi:hypothetical protein